jgi:YidC/Oxa1 family membrane protein insertase
MQYDQMRRLRKLQPELAKIRKKYPEMAQQSLVTMALYKKNGIKTSRSLISAVVQLPIIITIYRVIRMIVESSEPIARYGYESVKNMDGIKDVLSGSVEFKTNLFGIIDLSQAPFNSTGLTSVVLLIVLAAMAYSQYKITRISQATPTDKDGKKRRLRDIFSEASDGKEPDQAEMNQVISGSMTKFMPMMMFFTFGMFYGALSFYYLISNLFTITLYKIMDRKELAEVEIVEDHEISERLRKAEAAQLVNEQRQKKKRQPKAKTKSTVKTDSSGQRITRIKAKK